MISDRDKKTNWLPQFKQKDKQVTIFWISLYNDIDNTFINENNSDIKVKDNIPMFKEILHNIFNIHTTFRPDMADKWGGLWSKIYIINSKWAWHPKILWDRIVPNLFCFIVEVWAKTHALS